MFSTLTLSSTDRCAVPSRVRPVSMMSTVVAAEAPVAPASVHAARPATSTFATIGNPTGTTAWLGGMTGLGDTQGAYGIKRINPGRLGGVT